MSAVDVIQWTKALAILGGVVVGIYAVFSPAYVWHTRQLFGWGSAVLSGFGTVLIVASLFQTVSFRMGDAIELRLAEIRKEVEATKVVAEASKREVARALTMLSSQPAKADIAQLQTQLEQLKMQVNQIGETSNSALTGLKSINATIQKLPAFQNIEPRSQVPNSDVYKPEGQSPFAPTR